MESYPYLTYLPIIAIVLAGGLLAWWFTYGRNKLPELAPVNCKMSNGKDRPYPCEFEIVDMQIIGKNGVLQHTVIASGAPIKLLRSGASSDVEVDKTSSILTYLVKLHYRRVAKPSFPTPQYTIHTCVKSDQPSTSTELDVLETFTEDSKKLPGEIRESSFFLKLPYYLVDQPTLAPGTLKYIQLTNPVTFDKFISPMNQLRDRAEAALSFQLSVDFSK